MKRVFERMFDWAEKRPVHVTVVTYIAIVLLCGLLVHILLRLGV